MARVRTRNPSRHGLRRIWLAIAGAGIVAMAPLSHPRAAEHDVVATVAEPAGYRMEHYRSPVPPTLAGARVVDVEAVESAALDGAVLIDVYPRAPKPPGLPAGTVWRSPKHQSLKGAYWVPNVGYGILAPEPEAYFRAALERLAGGDKAKPLVFFCLADCWMSWNAAKRALEWGHTNVLWFPRGTDGWRDAGNALVNVDPEPGPDGKVPE